MIVHAGRCGASLCWQGHFWQNGARYWIEGHTGVDFALAAERAKITCEKCAREAERRINGTSLAVLDLSTRASKCFRYEEIFTIEYVDSMSDGELLRVPNFGRRSLKQVRNLIAQWRAERLLVKNSMDDFWPYLPL